MTLYAIIVRLASASFLARQLTSSVQGDSFLGTIDQSRSGDGMISKSNRLHVVVISAREVVEHDQSRS